MDETPEARRARYEQSEYGNDPETKQSVLRERRQEAGDDWSRRRDVARQDVVRQAVLRLWDEQGECVRLGRLFVDTVVRGLETLATGPPPDELPEPYRELLELHIWQLLECLDRAVATAEHCLVTAEYCLSDMAMETRAAVPLVLGYYLDIRNFLTPHFLDSHSPAGAMRLVIDRLGRSALLLESAFRAEFEPVCTESFPGVDGSTRDDMPTPSERAGEPPEALPDPSAPKTTPRRRNPPGRPIDTDPEEDRRIVEAWNTKTYTTYDDLAAKFKTDRLKVKLAIDRDRKRAGKTPRKK